MILVVNSHQVLCVKLKKTCIEIFKLFNRVHWFDCLVGTQFYDWFNQFRFTSIGSQSKTIKKVVFRRRQLRAISLKKYFKY